MSARLQSLYNGKVVDALKEQFKYDNVHQIPRVTKIVANMDSVRLSKTQNYRGCSQRPSSLTGQAASHVRRSRLRLFVFVKECPLVVR